jgi:hypothetical protein
MLQLHRRAPLVAIPLGLLALALLVSVVDRQTPLLLESHVRDADQRKELPPEEYAYWRRHERNQALCRGQTYVNQCCDHRLDDGALTCLNPEDIR